MDNHYDQVMRARARLVGAPARRYFAYSTVLDRASFEEWRQQHGYTSFTLPAGLAAAALDVLPEEPPSAAHPLIAAFTRREPWLDGRFILTPHAAFYSPASLIDLRRKTIETLVEFLRDGRLKNCVNAEFLPRGRAG